MAFKSGLWYTFANFLIKSLAFLTTPLFTRLLSQEEFGFFSNYISWLTPLSFFFALNLSATFISARFDFEDDFDSYIYSTLALTTLSVGGWFLVINLNISWWESMIGLQKEYLNTMLVYMIFNSAVDMFQARERFYFKYKTSVIISLAIALLSSMLSVWLVLTLENKLFGRILGQTIPTVLIGIGICIVIVYNGKKIRVMYWKYALPICLPYIPHLLSLTLLNSMDRMMITKMCGAEDTAKYSIAYSCGAIVTLFITSLNAGFSPWLGEKLKRKQYGEICAVSKQYILLFVAIAVNVMLFAPEILLIMGGKSYWTAIYVIPPVTLGCICQFLYTMYVNIEQYYKKTIGMAFASASAAGLNYVLNFFLIPGLGYIAAAYTTLIGFFWLLLLHMVLVYKMGHFKVYDIKFIFTVLACMIVFTFGINKLYHYTAARYFLIFLYNFLLVVICAKNRKLILELVRKKF